MLTFGGRAFVRVALLPSSYYPSVGGVEELTRRLAGELVARDHSVQVWSSRRDGDTTPRRDVIDGVSVRRFTFPMPRAAAGPLLRWPVQAAHVLAQLHASVRDFQPDVLHVQCFSSNGVYAAALSRLTGVPLVVSLQGETVMDDRDIYEHSLSLRGGLRFGLRQAAQVTACSRFTLNDVLERFGGDARTSQVIFNGVALEEGGAGEALELPFSVFALAIGRVVHKKGFDLLLQAFALLTDLPEGSGLVIGGDGAELTNLRAQAARLGISDRVYFTGTLTRAQVAWAMRQARCFVMPSRLEPFGIVVLEAWRAGTAVIASSIGGAPEFVEDGVSGLLVDPHDGERLAEALGSLLRDPVLAANLGRAGRRRVEDLTWPRLAQDYLAVYESTRGSHDGRSR